MIQILKFRITFSSLLASAVLIALACSNTKNTSQKSQGKESKVIGVINNTPVTYQELSDQYKSSNPSKQIKRDTATYKDVSDFLSLYLNYRAKLLEAKNAGYYQDKDIRNEMDQYAKQYAYTFWMDKKIRQELLDTLMARSKWDVNASHILIALSPQAPPEDTLKAYNKLMEARRKFLNGEPFSDLINEYSSKRNGRPMGGDLGYLSAGWAIKPFEDVAYTTPIDSVSMPVRTKFGYHLIYVHGRRKHKPERLVSHIYFQTRGNGNSIQYAMKRADSVYAQLQDGISWDKLVHLSDDRNSSQQNGLIGWVDRSRFRPTFTDTIFAIKQLHKAYHPFYSGYGVHIVKVDSIRTFKDKQQEEAYWLNRLKQLPRYKDNKLITLQHVKNEGQAKIFADNYASLAKIINKHDSVDFSKVNIPETILTRPIYQINNQSYSVGDFVDWLKDNVHNVPVSELYNHYLEFQNIETQKQLIPITEEHFPQYKKDIRRYMDGLVVYKITDDSVWSYAQRDTTALHKLFVSDSSKYWFPKRYNYYRLAANDDSTLNAALDKIQSGISPDSLRNNNPVHPLLVQEDVVRDLDGEPYERLKGLNEKQATKPFKFHDKQTVLYLTEIKPPAPMTFMEAYNQLITDFQPIRQKEWMENLHNKFHIEAYPDHLHQIFWSHQMNP